MFVGVNETIRCVTVLYLKHVAGSFIGIAQHTKFGRLETLENRISESQSRQGSFESLPDPAVTAPAIFRSGLWIKPGVDLNEEGPVMEPRLNKKADLLTINRTDTVFCITPLAFYDSSRTNITALRTMKSKSMMNLHSNKAYCLFVSVAKFRLLHQEDMEVDWVGACYTVRSGICG